MRRNNKIPTVWHLYYLSDFSYVCDIIRSVPVCESRVHLENLNRASASAIDHMHNLLTSRLPRISQ